MGKKTEVEFIGREIKVSVTDGSTTLTQTILPEMVSQVEKDFEVPSDAAVKFLVTYVSCSLRNVGDEAASQADQAAERQRRLADASDRRRGFVHRQPVNSDNHSSRQDQRPEAGGLQHLGGPRADRRREGRPVRLGGIRFR